MSVGVQPEPRTARPTTPTSTTVGTAAVPALQKASPVPLYYQLKTAIENLLDSGQWPPDSQVPSERRLCEQFKISRITVRQALAELVREGRLIRSHGRGTFVAQAQLRKPVFPLVSFTQDVREHGMQPGARVLEFEVISPPPHVVSALQLEAGDRMILLKRLRLANGKPMAVETVHLPSHRCPGLQGEHLTDQSLYETLSRTYGIVPTRANQQWQAVACPAADARLLEIPKGNPVLRIEQTTFDRTGRPFEHLESFFRGDKFIFYAELTNHR
jgi:GntR family transcriptional regulator